MKLTIFLELAFAATAALAIDATFLCPAQTFGGCYLRFDPAGQGELCS